MLETAGMRRERIMPVAAAYANLNNLDSSGLYSVLFGAVVDAATPPAREDDPPALLETLHARIRTDVGKPPRKVEDRLLAERMRTAPGRRRRYAPSWSGRSPPMAPTACCANSRSSRRPRACATACSTSTSDHATCAAAGIDDPFVFVDQLEESGEQQVDHRRQALARDRPESPTRLAGPADASRVHFVFTFHEQAAPARALLGGQPAARVFEATASNTASVVVLRGSAVHEQVAGATARVSRGQALPARHDPLLPFEADARASYATSPRAAPGLPLNRAHELLNAAAEQGLPKVDGAFARAHLETDGAAAAAVDEDEEPPPADLDDVILGLTRR